MLALALSCEPRLIIADEPTTALDVTIQAQILELMKKITDESGMALVIITHNLGIVARYANTVNIMYAGRVVEGGTADEIYASPRHPYTRGLMRSVPRPDVPRTAKLEPIEGQPPDLMDLPPGCSFAPRCPHVTDQCRMEAPPLLQVTPGHTTACWLMDQLEPATPVVSQLK
jgi:oligopeptide/dipeptide ABC transporter ATP-binding protein